MSTRQQCPAPDAPDFVYHGAPVITTTLNITVVILAYLAGSVSSAIIFCRLAKLPDPRTQGSGNPGATNVLRFGGKKLAAVVLLGDMLKGLLPVILARYLDLEVAMIALAGFAAFIGHLYPVFFGFKGGKGVATALGVMLGLSWLGGLLMIVIWILVAMIFKISSLAAITAAALAPGILWVVEPYPEYIVVATVISLLLLWRHRSNIRNLVSGNEPNIGKKSPP